MLTLITFIIVLSILVFVHELGHFWVARKCGVKAEEFGFGFPPRIIGIYKDKNGKWKYASRVKQANTAPNTIYSINWIPLGGFVRIKGEDGENQEDKDSFISHPVWQKFLIISAGVAMNIILAIILFSAGFMVGLPQALDGLSNKAQVFDKKIQITQIIPNSAADKAGLKLADTIISINNKKFDNEQDLINFVRSMENKELSYVIQRDNKEISFTIIPTIRQETGMAGIGIAIVTTGLVKYPWYLAVWEGVKTTVILIWVIIIAFYELIKNLILGNGLSVDLAGPVGIATLTGQAARMGIVYILQFIALLSINLAIINFLPFPALDGGRILFLIIEKIKGSPVKRELEALIHQIGFALLMVLVIFVTIQDVAKFNIQFSELLKKIF